MGGPFYLQCKRTDPGSYQRFVGKFNSHWWRGHPPGTLFCAAIWAKRVHPGSHVWLLIWTFRPGKDYFTVAEGDEVKYYPIYERTDFGLIGALIEYIPEEESADDSPAEEVEGVDKAIG